MIFVCSKRAGGGKRRELGMMTKWYGVSFQSKEKNVLKWIVVMDAQLCEDPKSI